MAVIAIGNVSEDQLQQFADNNGISYPILRDIGGAGGGPGGGEVYDQYYLPGQGSPYPRDFIIDQGGIIQYANNEIDTEAMLLVLGALLDSPNLMPGDLNFDGLINILDVVTEVNIVLGIIEPSGDQLSAGDLNNDALINILDIVLIVNIILEF